MLTDIIIYKDRVTYEEKPVKPAIIKQILFRGKQNISWDQVEKYLKKYVGESYIAKNYGDLINIAGDFPDEYTESDYTKLLRGANAKAKANAAQIIPEMIEIAENRRWIENKKEKHNHNASKGWYRYDTLFALPKENSLSGSDTELRSIYRATLVVRISEKGLFLYDVINIKKEASTPPGL